MSIRLFNTDEGELAEMVTEDGRNANLCAELAIQDLVEWADTRGYNLRDFELIVGQHLHTEIARAIIMRRKKAPQ